MSTIKTTIVLDGKAVDLKVDEDQLKNLIQKGKIVEGITIEMPVFEASKKSDVIASINFKRPKDILRASVEERKVIRAWNRNDYMINRSPGAKETRNHRLPFKSIPSILPLVKESLRKHELEYILEKTDKYFKYCSLGKHIKVKESKNYGYVSLFAYLSKLNSLDAKSKVWWEEETAIPDKLRQIINNKLVRYIAKKYGQIILGKKDYVLDISDTITVLNFGKTARLVTDYTDNIKKSGGFTRNIDVVRYLLESLKQYWKDSPIVSGQLCSPTTWNQIFPQYMKEVGVA